MGILFYLTTFAGPFLSGSYKVGWSVQCIQQLAIGKCHYISCRYVVGNYNVKTVF